jgi:hypothetical protein
MTGDQTRHVAVTPCRRTTGVPDPPAWNPLTEGVGLEARGWEL